MRHAPFPPLITVSLLAALLFAGCGNAPDEVIAVGTLEWNRIEVAAQAAEPVLAWEAREGAQVTAGQPLLKLDSERQRARLAAAEAARAQAAARMAELERGTRPERIAQARATLAGSEQELLYRQREANRLEILVARKLASPDQIDLARTAAANARALRDGARATLDELEHGATAEEREQARQALAAAEAELQAARVELSHTDIEAPVAGRLDELPFRVGERPPLGGVVAVILAGERPYARVYVPEALRVHVLPGQGAQVQIDGIDTAFAGSVRRISSDPSFTPYFALTEHDRGRLSFVAEVDVETNGRELPAGVPVQVRFARD
jgi:HlyD family secretion protein